MKDSPEEMARKLVDAMPPKLAQVFEQVAGVYEPKNFD